MSKILEIQSIHKRFGIGTVNEHHVLKGLDLTLEKGDFVTIIGGNGAGKSTLMNSISGVFPVDSGKILIDKKDVTNLKASERASDISRVFQDPCMGTATRLSIEENLAIAHARGEKRGIRKGVSDKNRAFYQEKLATLGLGLENRMKAEVGLLSGGQRQALTLLMATLISPKVLLLDEHTAALDPKTSLSVLELTNEIVQQNQLTSLMITHNMEDAIQYGNRLIMLHSGKIVVDIKGSDKKGLTVKDLLDLFQKNSGQALSDDALILK